MTSCQIPTYRMWNLLKKHILESVFSMSCWTMWWFLNTLISNKCGDCWSDCSFQCGQKSSQNFSFLWKYLTMSPQELEQASASMINEYPEDLTHDIIQEMNHLPTVHCANFGSAQLTPSELLNSLMEYRLHQLFPNVCTCLHSSLGWKIFQQAEIDQNIS